MFLRSFQILSLTLVLFFSSRPAAHADWCGEIFGGFGQRLQRSVVAAARTDSRLAAIKLGRASPTFNRMDHFSSPALLMTTILHHLVPQNFKDYLNSQIQSPMTLSTALAKRGALPASVAILADLLESRFRIESEMAVVLKRTEVADSSGLTPAEYAEQLLARFRTVAGEISSTGSGRRFFDKFDLEAVDWAKMVSDLEVDVQKNLYFQYQPARTAVIFRDGFSAQFQDLPLGDLMTHLEGYLDQQLESLPVGISYRILELDSNLRLGDLHLYQSYNDSKFKYRKAYLANGKERGGIIEALLKLSPDKKKLLSVLAWERHPGLDPLCPLTAPKTRRKNTCGSYAPMILIRSGVPILSPIYFSPTMTLVSLAVQKAMGMTHVQSVTLTHTTSQTWTKGLPVVLWHDGTSAIFEGAIYLATAYGLLQLL